MNKDGNCLDCKAPELPGGICNCPQVNGKIQRRFEYDLLEICLRLHEFVQGTNTGLATWTAKEWADVLRFRLKTWRPSTCDFDVSVKNLIQTTLMEFDLYMK